MAQYWQLADYLEVRETMLRLELASTSPLLTPSTKVDDVLRKQGVELVILYKSIFKLLQHLKYEGKFLLVTRTKNQQKRQSTFLEHTASRDHNERNLWH